MDRSWRGLTNRGDNGGVSDTDKHPVIAGLVALVAVALVIGAIGGLGLLMGVKVAGIGEGGGGSSTDSTAGGLYLPKPTPTETEASEDEQEEPSSEESPTEEATPQQGINLSAGQTSVAPMQQIDLTGTYPTGEGAILQVQRLENGSWSDFPVTMSVSGSTFATYVMTSRSGENTFRVIDTDTQVTSNEVKVTVG